MRRIFFSLGLLSVAATASLAEDGHSRQLSRAQSVINAFQVICQLELPDLTFERIDSKGQPLVLFGTMRFERARPFSTGILQEAGSPESC